MNLRLQKRLGYGGSKHPLRRARNTWIGRMLARRTGGGLVFLDDAELLACLCDRLGLEQAHTLDEYRAELLGDEPMRRAFEAARERYGLTADADWDARVARLGGIVTVYYALMREVRPEVVVETGTAEGGYTSFVLAAMERNGRGRLISIDIPPVDGKLTMDLTVAESDVGYFIPVEYRGRWEYRKGDAKVLLPHVLLEVDADVFIHDSLHTRTHMLFEYAVARALMKEGKLILSDDIMWNEAFQGFLTATGIEGFSPYGRPDTGVCINTFDDFERDAGLGVYRVD